MVGMARYFNALHSEGQVRSSRYYRVCLVRSVLFAFDPTNGPSGSGERVVGQMGVRIS